MKKEVLYAEVVFPLPLDKSFDYLVPPFFKEISVGVRVKAPFGRGSKVGYLVGLKTKSHLPSRVIKPLEALIDEVPLIDERLLELSRRIHRYYLCSWGEVLEAVFPASLKPRKRMAELPAAADGEPEATPPLLEETSQQALRAISENRGDQGAKTFLLLGGTSEEKQELIFQAIQKMLERGLSTIVLYPEIALIRDSSRRFKRRFGQEVCFFHSQLSPLDRYDIWKSIKEGNHRLVVGVRSAIFSPVQRLGLIVCCEEENSAYKQEEAPRYHIRKVALMRSELEGATLLLESEAPSLESYTEALEGRYTLLKVKGKKEGLLPKVSVMDMREEMLNQKRKVIFSKYLERQMSGTLKEKGQVLLFLNRRGFSTFVHCKRCGVILRCESCAVPLKYHSTPKRLICHYCNRQEVPPTICPNCRGSYLYYTGVGTEKVESEVHRVFPEARIARLDADSAKEEPYQKLAGAFQRKELDVLIGTQRVAREVVPGGVPLVGILSADTLLNAPNFRSGERAFALMNRLVGQAVTVKGDGEVVIQSFSPGHPAILASASRDYPAFYSQEIRSRKEFGFPPFRFLAKVVFRGKIEEKVGTVARAFKKLLGRLRKGKKIALLGPAPVALRKVRGNYEWQLLVKSEKEDLADFLKKPIQHFQKSRAVKLVVDIDPY